MEVVEVRELDELYTGIFIRGISGIAKGPMRQGINPHDRDTERPVREHRRTICELAGPVREHRWPVPVNIAGPVVTPADDW